MEIEKFLKTLAEIPMKETVVVSYEEKGVISTLETPGLNGKRRDGNTTRQVDFAIQQLFKGNKVITHDHYLDGNNSPSNLQLLERIGRRLNAEYLTGFVADQNLPSIKLTYKIEDPPF